MTLFWLLLVPLVAGPLAFFLRRRPAMEVVNLAAFAIALGLAAALGRQVLRNGPVSLWDGFLYADALSSLVVLLTSFVALVCSIYAVGYFRHDEQNTFLQNEDVLGEIAGQKLRKYYSLMPLFVFSMLLVALANNLGVLWVAIEGTTLASVFLVTFYGRETSLEAAWKYAIIGGVGLSMALFGTILAYYAAHRYPGDRNPGRSELVGACRKCCPARQANHAVGFHPDSARLRNEGGDCSYAYMEAGCLQ